jgi:hypothetical protein
MYSRTLREYLLQSLVFTSMLGVNNQVNLGMLIYLLEFSLIHTFVMRD